MLSKVFKWFFSYFNSWFGIQLSLAAFWCLSMPLIFMCLLVEYGLYLGSQGTVNPIPRTLFYIFDSTELQTRLLWSGCIVAPWFWAGALRLFQDNDDTQLVINFIFLMLNVLVNAAFIGNIYGNYGPPGRWILEFLHHLV